LYAPEGSRRCVILARYEKRRASIPMGWKRKKSGERKRELESKLRREREREKKEGRGEGEGKEDREKERTLTILWRRGTLTLGAINSTSREP